MCPKCQGTLRTVDRGGVRIEQCGTCRGVFLDAGELEQILAAEQRYNELPAYEAPEGFGPSGPTVPGPYRPPSPAQAPSPPPQQYRRYEDSPRPYRGGYRDSPPPYGHHKRRKSFLETLFD